VQLILTGREHLGDDVWRFSFASKYPVTWLAGQFIRIDVPHEHPDASGTSRFFTVSSSPASQKPQITTRLTSSSFKQALAALPDGSPVTLLDLPAGDFTWPDHLPDPVFVAHGIGITPFLSILQDRADRHRPLPATLVHSNRPDAFVPFAAELADLAKSHLEFTYLRLKQLPTAAFLATTFADLSARTVYVSGPHKLLELLAPPYGLTSRQLKTDYFPGYAQSDY